MCLCNTTWMSYTLTLFGILFCFSFDNFSYCSVTSGKAKRSHLVRLFNPELLNACIVVSHVSMSYKNKGWPCSAHGFTYFLFKLVINIPRKGLHHIHKTSSFGRLPLHMSLQLYVYSHLSSSCRSLDSKLFKVIIQKILVSAAFYSVVELLNFAILPL